MLHFGSPVLNNVHFFHGILHLYIYFHFSFSKATESKSRWDAKCSTSDKLTGMRRLLSDYRPLTGYKCGISILLDMLGQFKQAAGHFAISVVILAK